MKFVILVISMISSVSSFAAESSAQSDEAIVQAAETLLRENETPQVKTPMSTSSVSQKESEIPVNLNIKKEEPAKSNLAWRLAASLGLILTVGGLMVLAGRRWTRQKDRGGNKARIEILHQFHLGNRKSLALVRVSGEAILIGISDHNINMIKTITLIDDELEGMLKKDFNNFLEDEFSIEDVRSALNARA